MNLSLLQNVAESDVLEDPFPHVVVENALPDAIHEQIRESFPDPSLMGIDSSSNNKRWSIMASELDECSGVSDLWREFVRYHSSQDFWNDFVRVFGPSVVRTYPVRFGSVADLRELKVQVRDADKLDQQELALDAQISGNTPAVTPGRPRGIHTDHPMALYAGLYYLRSKDDDSVGGDLELWRWNAGYSYQRKSSAYHEDVATRHVQLVRTIPYRSNTFVILLNSLDSLHSVTIRNPTTHHRQFLNLLADSNRPFFELNPWLHTRVRRAMHNRLSALLRRI